MKREKVPPKYWIKLTARFPRSSITPFTIASSKFQFPFDPDKLFIIAKLQFERILGAQTVLESDLHVAGLPGFDWLVIRAKLGHMNIRLISEIPLHHELRPVIIVLLTAQLP